MAEISKAASPGGPYEEPNRLGEAEAPLKSSPASIPEHNARLYGLIAAQPIRLSITPPLISILPCPRP